MPRIVFTPSGLDGEVAPGTSVLAAARELGVDLDSVCGGRGICGRCQVEFHPGTYAKWAIEVDDEKIHAIIRSHPEAQSCADALVTAAVESGGRDNVTVIVVDVVDGIDPAEIAGIPADASDDDTVSLTRTTVISDEPPPPLEQPVIASKHQPTKVQQQLGRQMTLKTFLIALGVAIVAMLVIVFVAAALTDGDDDAPAPSTTVTETTVPETTVTETSEPDTTTTTVRPTTTTSAPTSTSPAGATTSVP